MFNFAQLLPYIGFFVNKRKSSCVKTQEAYHPRHILSMVFPALVGGGGRQGGEYPVLVLAGGSYPVLVLVGGGAGLGIPCLGPDWGQGGRVPPRPVDKLKTLLSLVLRTLAVTIQRRLTVMLQFILMHLYSCNVRMLFKPYYVVIHVIPC